MRRTIPGFVWRGDGRVNYNRQPGYEILFQAKIDGRDRTAPHDPPARRRHAAARGRRHHDDRRAVGDDPARRRGRRRTGALKTAIRSFRFGTERP
jgi:hypothetical protein